MRKIPHKLGTYNYTRLETILLAFTMLMIFGLSGLVLYVLFDFLWYSQYQKYIEAGKDTKTLDILFWIFVFLYLLIYIGAVVLAYFI